MPHWPDRQFYGDQMATLQKSCDFLKDPRFKFAFYSNADNEFDQQPAWRLHTLCWAAKHALKLPGDFVECGVYTGFMSNVVADFVDFSARDKTFYLYDTFSGFDDRYSSANDFHLPGFYNFIQEQYTRPNLYDEVVARFKPYQNIKVLRGAVPDVLAEDSPTSISYLHIDMNSPAAEVAALDVLFDRVVPGGLIILDDYGWAMFHKQKEAEDQWFADRGYMAMELPTGQGLVIKR